MDKNLPKDPLEEFFKKSLEGQNELPSDNGWDIPSLNVWDRVEADIQPTAIVRPINYWKWATVVASMVLLFFTYKWSTQNEQIEELVIEINENNEQLETVKGLLKNKEKEIESLVVEQNIDNIYNQQSIENEEVVQRDDVRVSHRATHFSEKNKNEIGGKNNNESPKNPTLNTGNMVNQKVENIIVENLDKANFDNSKEELIDKKIIQEINELPKRNFVVESSVDNEKLKAEWGRVATFNLKKERLNSKLFVGVYGSRNFGMRSIVADDSSISQIRKNEIKNIREKESWTTGGGVKLGFQINKNWSIETGLQYTKSEITARHLIQKQYNAASEIQNSSGDFENEFAFLLVTPMGDVESDVTLSRSAMSTAIPDQLVYIPVESNQKISFLGIPILAKYRFGNETFRLGLKGGVLANFILDADVEISTVDTPFPNLRHRKHRISNKTELENLKTTTINWLAGVEAEVKLNDKMYFLFEPSFSKNISPIFEKNNVKTYPLMANVKVGVNYLF